MSASFIRFIVLGKIPGTTIVLSFWIMVLLLMTLTALFVLVLNLHAGRKIVRLINPFFATRRKLFQVDLISL